MLVNPADKTTVEVELGDGETFSRQPVEATSRFLYWVTSTTRLRSDPCSHPDPTVDPTPVPAPTLTRAQPRARPVEVRHFGWWYVYSDGTHAERDPGHRWPIVPLRTQAAT